MAENARKTELPLSDPGSVWVSPALGDLASDVAVRPGRPPLHLVPEPAEPAKRYVAAPFIKWVGGKTRLLPSLEALQPSEIGRYAEPFLGGGAFYFHLQREVGLRGALLVDLNPDVVNVWRVLRDEYEALLLALDQHQLNYLAGDDTERAAYFYRVRSRHPDEYEMSAVDRAARMLFLNRTCFNGLWRENRSGRFNTPHGRYKRPRIVQLDKLKAASAALQETEIVRSDFRRLPELVRQHAIDFVYLDPPYHPVSVTSTFNAYSRGAFTAQDQTELAAVCRELDAMGVRFMLSNSDCELVRDLYQGFDLKLVQAPRAINCKGNKRGAVSEVVVRNLRPGLRW